MFPTKFWVIRLKAGLIGTVCLLLSCLLVGSCAPSSGFDARLNEIVRPYRFDLFSWELQALSYELEDLVFGGGEVAADESPVVIDYFSVTEQFRALEREIEAVRDEIVPGDLALLKDELDALQKQKDALEDKAEKVLERQVKETLAQLGIFNPMDSYLGLEITFPPVNFALEQPPRLLVVSPRERIESIRGITLRQDITMEEIEDIEAAVDELGVSSLVVGLGGISTYPAFVSNDAGLGLPLIQHWRNGCTSTCFSSHWASCMHWI